jgi:RNA polymerase sigma-70 factor, ECF subfamily
MDDAALSERSGDVCARAARGDRAALVDLYEAHHAHVRAFARRVVGDEALAEDLVHEVFLALPKALQGFRGECNVRSYIVSVAAKRAHRQIRSAARRRATESSFSREPTSGPELPDDAAVRREMAELLMRALDELPVDQRVAFVLCEVEERTSTEVGAMLGEKDATVRARVMLAKKKLRGILAKPSGRGAA